MGFRRHSCQRNERGEGDAQVKTGIPAIFAVHPLLRTPQMTQPPHPLQATETDPVRRRAEWSGPAPNTRRPVRPRQSARPAPLDLKKGTGPYSVADCRIPMVLTNRGQRVESIRSKNGPVPFCARAAGVVEPAPGSEKGDWSIFRSRPSNSHGVAQPRTACGNRFDLKMDLSPFVTRRWCRRAGARVSRRPRGGPPPEPAWRRRPGHTTGPPG